MNIRKISDRKLIRGGLCVTAALALWVAPAAAAGATANGQVQEIQVKTLGGRTRFSQPMRSVDALRSMAKANRDQISRVLAIAGLGDLSAQVLDALVVGEMTDAVVAPGTQFQWMALKRSGTPGLLRNVRWSGRESFDAYQFSVKAAGYIYTFVVPKVCGNLSLLSATASPLPVVAAFEPPPPPLPPPAPPVEAPLLVAAPTPPPPPPSPEPPPPAHAEWIASGFAGSSFSTSANAQSHGINDNVTFGGQVSYAWHGLIGGELLADFAPGVRMTNVALASDPTVNSYMMNVFGAVPLGTDGWFQPYASGGLGSISMHASVLAVPGLSSSATTDGNQSRLGTDIGGGLMMFAGHFGVRGDVRYYKTSGTAASVASDTSANGLTGLLLQDLQFWRANLGVSFRW